MNTTNGNKGVSTFNVEVMHSFQSDCSSSFHQTIKKYMDLLYKNTKEYRCCRVILVSILKHAFVEEWLPKVILTYKNNVRSFLHWLQAYNIDHL